MHSVGMQARSSDEELKKENKVMLNGTAVLSYEARKQVHHSKRLRIVHRCYSGNACNCTGYVDSLSRTIRIVQATRYRRRPKKPSTGDWTKNGGVE